MGLFWCLVLSSKFVVLGSWCQGEEEYRALCAREYARFALRSIGCEASGSIASR